MDTNDPQTLESVLSPPLQQENLRGQFLGKLEGRKRACAMCAKAGRKRKEGQGRTFETSYTCEQCGVPLCRQMRGERSCFAEWHG